MCLLVLSAAMRIWAQQHPPSPPGGETIHIDVLAPPDTLAKMYADSDLVIHGVVASSGAPTTIPGAVMPVVIRHQEVRVLEILKSDPTTPTPSGNVSVIQHGGTTHVNGREFSTDYPADLLEPGEEVILFLAKSTRLRGYTIAYASAGVFAVTADRSTVVPKRVKQLMPEFKGRDTLAADELLGALRGFRDRR